MVAAVTDTPAEPTSVEVQVPATSANLGPGFDCLGCAVSLHNRVRLTRLPGAPVVTPEHPMVAGAAAVFFKHPDVRLDTFGFRWQIEGDVPISRGLGSSVTLRLGVLAGLNALAGEPLDRAGLLDLCTEAEGHPDNAGPGVYGGFFVGATRQWFHFPVDPALRFVLLIPNNEVLTDPSRGALPVSIPHADAVRNGANACALVAAFASRRYDRLPGAFEDYLHQAYRAHLIPGLFEVIRAGTAAGALGGWLSGSGSTIACLTHRAEAAAAIAEAMTAAHDRCRPAEEAPARIEIVPADNTGVTVAPDSPAPSGHGPGAATRPTLAPSSAP